MGAIAGLAWWYVIHLAREMSPRAMDMAMPMMQQWGAMDLLLLFVMWLVMMVAMMVPSATPMILLFATVTRQRRERQASHPAVPTGVFLLGYLLVWAGYSAIATSAQWALHSAALLSPMMVTTSTRLGGALLIVAGLFQFTPLKALCLTRCRSPLGFLTVEWREGVRGALIMGIKHGGYCVTCCWSLMALLFVAGVMNLLWVAAIAVLVLLEKMAPSGRLISRAAGVVLVAGGVWMASGGM
ncbi:MAG: DUF2182 domain-containing protein [Gemmatimonadota bacterium]|nr:DUF2182 domain-containing protein [Gemmatimonadota bacterium]